MLSRINAHLLTGANLYTRGLLRVYDATIHTINGNYLWKFSTKSVLIPFFHANSSPRHMDVGVGAGYSPYNRHKQDNSLTLPGVEHRQFDSISLMYVFHCLPCSPIEKGRIFTNLKSYLSSQGTLSGATILGCGTSQHWLSRLYIKLYNWACVFHNKDRKSSRRFGTML
ncbi:uncharacterized protein EURHEDRAFT_516680 [Aspergillus ruber CBS 135680]|uniref:Uncharacterized protein n=1 Tax=Aspergillus ruber (strain CBS 135680) TaxID=1388766 RepID=A0A017S998_ASPRC|nr:uncharacterized protein EURHEDRAFT_516680 [Aspergillus ruber CBS 135680]EYE93396.1 hypothetical protein EURHEDRAFT_516680 [Aspergillus ruber CBS 135680]